MNGGGNFVGRFLNFKAWNVCGGWAIDNVGSATKLRLSELGLPGASGRFDPAKTKAWGSVVSGGGYGKSFIARLWIGPGITATSVKRSSS